MVDAQGVNHLAPEADDAVRIVEMEDDDALNLEQTVALSMYRKTKSDVRTMETIAGQCLSLARVQNCGRSGGGHIIRSMRLLLRRPLKAKKKEWRRRQRCQSCRHAKDKHSEHCRVQSGGVATAQMTRRTCVRDAVKFHRLLPVSLPSTDTLSRSPLGTKRTPFKRQCSRTHSPPLSPSSPSLRKEKAKKKVTV
ncbi:hypothetical protein SAY86_014715 [Trapa natans]|uniref:Uncharacterized protein n=1 Tax=Trapa natans TaxID=22666 RepID=A0AAN7KKU4_TRANT|nr:hypothetical protein SAY86_014715 [Trapa natans]